MDKNTTDKGWEAMQQLLDREMPVKNTRRRLVLGWWWLLLPLVGYSTWQWMKPTPVSPLQTTQILAQNTLNQTSTADNIPKQAPQVNRTLASNPPENPTSVAKQEANIANSISARPSFDNSLSTGKVSDGKSIQKALEYSGEIKPEIQEINSQTAANPLSTEVLHTSLQNIDNQSNKPEISLKNIPANVIKPNVSPAVKSWRFGAITALTSEQFNSINGFSTGVSVDWAFSPKWGMRSGLLYQILTPEENHRPIASINSSDYAANIAPNLRILDAYSGVPLSTPISGSYVDSLSDQILIPLNRIQRLELPISLFWQPNAHIKVLGGLTVSHTLTSRADRQNYSGQYLVQLTNQAAQDEANRLISNQIGRWDAVATLGIGWAIGQQFELGISTRLPFSKQPYYAPTVHTGGPTTLPGPAEPKRLYTPTYGLHGILFF